jgi:acyl-CoA reductase-like NAD-dependent aldehyde dehydrogenase
VRNLVSKFAFKWVNLYCYAAAITAGNTMVLKPSERDPGGAVQVEVSQLTRSLKPPGFNP